MAPTAIPPRISTIAATSDGASASPSHRVATQVGARWRRQPAAGNRDGEQHGGKIMG